MAMIQVTSDNIDALASMHATTQAMARVPYHEMSKLNYLNDDYDTEEYRLNLIKVLHAGGDRDPLTSVYTFQDSFGTLVLAWCEIYDVDFTQQEHV